VISVHSVVSWDFALAVIPGWHTTIFAPYFVAGAIHSGLAMVLTLMIPLRRIFHYEQIITMHVLESVAKTIVFTGLIVGFAYGTEMFIAWYSRNIVEMEAFRWRAFGDYAIEYWIMVICNTVIPLLLLFKKVRTHLPGFWAFPSGQHRHVVRALCDHHRFGGPRFSALCLGVVPAHPGRIRHHARQLLPLFLSVRAVRQAHAVGLHDRDEGNPA
jgi:Ni/Fe-hydrogenase subunit HybB-like protein